MRKVSVAGRRGRGRGCEQGRRGQVAAGHGVTGMMMGQGREEEGGGG